MIKTITTLKRKAGISTADFRAYYEANHRLIGEKYLSGYATRYMRRYLDPVLDSNGEAEEPEFDVVLEIWFPNIDAWRACGEILSSPSASAEIVRDEEQLFDRARKRTYMVEEVESEMQEVCIQADEP